MFSHFDVRALPRIVLLPASQLFKAVAGSSLRVRQGVLVFLCGCLGASAWAQSAVATSVPPSSVDSASAPQSVEISFALSANGTAVQCGTPIAKTGSSAVPATLRDARFYVQDIALVDQKGQLTPVNLTPSDWQNEQVALIDFEDASGTCAGGTPATNTIVKGTVPAGKYTGLAFTVGVPVSKNHTSTELEGAPLDLASMGWSWQAGRKFIKFEVNPDGGVTKADGSKSPTWFVHLGSTGCTGNPVSGETVSCMRPNRLPVVLNSFDPAKQNVVLDLAALFGSSELGSDSGGAVGCMSNPADKECNAIFERLGLALETGLSLKPGVSPVFSAGLRP